MATLTIRNLDDALKRELRVRAASRNRSMEEEVRQILRAALVESAEPAMDLASRIRGRFSGLGDIQMVLPEREAVRAPPDFGDKRQATKGRSGAVAAGRPVARRRK